MKARTLLSLCGLAISSALLVCQVSRLWTEPSYWPPLDFVEYWGAGRLCWQGENPYSEELLLETLRLAGIDYAVMMWNPPWTLTLVMPFGLLPFRTAQFIWLIVNFAALCASAALLGRTYLNNHTLRWIPWVITFTFMPTYFALQYGQIVPILFFGAAVFAWAVRTNRPFLAGAATVLMAIKPHLVYLVWLAIALDAATNRRWRVLGAAILLGMSVAIIPVAFNHDIYWHYISAMKDRPPDQWVTLTLGALLRFAFGEEEFWLQFAPVLLGIAWFAARWKKYGKNWLWEEQFPALVMISFVTTPYGAWHFDLVLLLIPLVQRAACLAEYGYSWISKWAIAVYIVMNLLMLTMSLAWIDAHWFAFVAPLVLILWTVTSRDPHPIPLHETVRA